jgi:hypothetical protein
MLHFLVGYLAGTGIDARWVMLEGGRRRPTPRFP